VVVVARFLLLECSWHGGRAGFLVGCDGRASSSSNCGKGRVSCVTSSARFIGLDAKPVLVLPHGALILGERPTSTVTLFKSLTLMPRVGLFGFACFQSLYSFNASGSMGKRLINQKPSLS